MLEVFQVSPARPSDWRRTEIKLYEEEEEDEEDDDDDEMMIMMMFRMVIAVA